MESTPVVLHEEVIAEARAAREWYEVRSAAAVQANRRSGDRVAKRTATDVGIQAEIR
ncbi:MAG: hypothetical protein ABSH28_15785 [Acidobacteriota bacterium]|jgi:hypothetical protein